MPLLHVDRATVMSAILPRWTLNASYGPIFGLDHTSMQGSSLRNIGPIFGSDRTSVQSSSLMTIHKYTTSFRAPRRSAIFIDCPLRTSPLRSSQFTGKNPIVKGDMAPKQKASIAHQYRKIKSSAGGFVSFIDGPPTRIRLARLFFDAPHTDVNGESLQSSCFGSGCVPKFLI